MPKNMCIRTKIGWCPCEARRESMKSLWTLGGIFQLTFQATLASLRTHSWLGVDFHKCLWLWTNQASQPLIQLPDPGLRRRGPPSIPARHPGSACCWKTSTGPVPRALSPQLPPAPLPSPLTTLWCLATLANCSHSLLEGPWWDFASFCFVCLKLKLVIFFCWTVFNRAGCWVIC